MTAYAHPFIKVAAVTDNDTSKVTPVMDVTVKN